MLIFLRLILASLVADFLLQPASLVAWKKSHVRGLVVHALVYCALALLAGWGYWSWRYAACVLALTALHTGVDWGKVRLDRLRPQGFWPLGTFVADQVLHLGFTAGILVAFDYLSAQSLLGGLRAAAGDSRIVAALSIYVASVLGGSVAVRLLVQAFEGEVTRRPGLLRAGAYIGIVERLLIASLVAENQFAAVGFVLAAKSIARHKELNDPHFAEYYLR